MLFMHYCKKFGGCGRIRTHGQLSPPSVFKTDAISLSTTHPYKNYFLRLFLSFGALTVFETVTVLRTVTLPRFTVAFLVLVVVLSDIMLFIENGAQVKFTVGMGDWTRTSTFLRTRTSKDRKSTISSHPY